MKLAVPIGALSGNSVHVIFPAVVSMMAVGLAEVAAAAGLAAVLDFAAVAGLAAGACAHAADAINIKLRIANGLRIDAPVR
jgi:hypothetical protein